MIALCTVNREFSNFAIHSYILFFYLLIVLPVFWGKKDSYKGRTAWLTYKECGSNTDTNRPIYRHTIAGHFVWAVSRVNGYSQRQLHTFL